MPGAVGKLFVSLTTKTGPYSKGMTKAGAITTKFAKGIGGVGLKIAKVGAIMGAAAVGGIALFTKRSFEAIDAQAKLARQVGASIDGLRGLQRAAIITGASESAVTKGLGFLNKALGEAKTGIGEGKQALEQLGLSADELAELPAEQAVSKIADGMNKLATQSDKAFVASKLFGRGGLALVNTLALGSKGLEEMAAGAKTLQGSMSASDASKVEEANDAVADLGLSFRSIFDRVAVAVGPFVTSIAKKLTKLMVFIRESVGPLVPMWLDRLKAIAQGVLGFVSNVVGWFMRLPGNIEVIALEMRITWAKLWSRFETEWLTFKAIFETGWVGVVTFVADMADNIKKAFFNAISAVGDKIVQIAQFLVDKLPGKNQWAQNLIDGYKQGLGAVDSIAENITRRQNKRWQNFWGNNQGGAKKLGSEVDKLDRELANLQKGLRGRQADIFAGEGSGLESVYKKLAEGIKKVKLPNVVDAIESGGVAAAKGIKKALSPKALEKGTVAAFSANLKASLSKAKETGKKTVDQLKEGNKIAREGNKLLAANLAGNVVMEIG